MDLPGPLVVIPPSRRPHTHTVIFLHGRGDSARALAENLHHFADSRGWSLFENFPSFRWVFPQANLCDVAATGDRTFQWFDTWNMRDLGEREELQREGLAGSVGRMRRLAREEVERLGGRWEKVVLAGISQGGATAVQTLLNLDFKVPEEEGEGEGEGTKVRRIGAVVGISCRLPFPRKTLAETRAEVGVWTGEGGEGDDEVVRNTAVLLEHCADDPLVRVETGREVRDRLVDYGAPVTWKEYPDGGHWFNYPAGADDMGEFLRREFGLGRDGAPLGGS
ncbi:related to lysophospholipase [Cephalotrichum gorgonifer]|uniref:Related to lysophospholipase n=1 Tax=Cephalotrichum gorgonifer TaxID=2041049 RepID=A0AAE8SZY9_9PEZI|nr:related to lysophospholipase [Cephalotrichum gorgonifer]